MWHRPLHWGGADDPVKNSSTFVPNVVGFKDIITALWIFPRGPLDTKRVGVVNCTQTSPNCWSFCQLWLC